MFPFILPRYINLEHHRVSGGLSRPLAMWKHTVGASYLRWGLLHFSFNDMTETGQEIPHPARRESREEAKNLRKHLKMAGPVTQRYMYQQAVSLSVC